MKMERTFLVQFSKPAHVWLRRSKTVERDGYFAVQLGFDDKKEKHTTKAEMGHFKKVNTTPKRKLIEFTGFEKEQVNEGDVLTVDFFAPDVYVDVRGWSKGKGFQGVVKRHGFAGVGGQTHWSA